MECTTGWRNPEYCSECNKELSDKEVDHGLEGFGHQKRCCDCYDKAMMGPDYEAVMEARKKKCQLVNVKFKSLKKHDFVEVKVIVVNNSNMKGLQCMSCYQVFVGRARDKADEHVCL